MSVMVPFRRMSHLQKMATKDAKKSKHIKTRRHEGHKDTKKSDIGKTPEHIELVEMTALSASKGASKWKKSCARRMDRASRRERLEHVESA
jgi:hypothetical protein